MFPGVGTHPPLENRGQSSMQFSPTVDPQVRRPGPPDPTVRQYPPQSMPQRDSDLTLDEFLQTAFTTPETDSELPCHPSSQFYIHSKSAPQFVSQHQPPLAPQYSPEHQLRPLPSSSQISPESQFLFRQHQVPPPLPLPRPPPHPQASFPSPQVSLLPPSSSAPTVRAPLYIRVPLPVNGDQFFRIPIRGQSNDQGLAMARMMSLWDSFWERLKQFHESGGSAGAFDEGPEFYQAVSSVIHPEHASQAAAGEDMIYTDCCPMPGELWGVHGRTTTVSTVTQLLARIVPSMFQWYRNLKASPALAASWQNLPGPDPEPRWVEWLKNPNINDVWIVAIRRTINDHLGTRYFPEIVINLP